MNNFDILFKQENKDLMGQIDSKYFSSCKGKERKGKEMNVQDMNVQDIKRLKN